ncbi:MAG: hypothetical protein KUG64_10325 [Cycloclasticus sp.]|nr:hypothetical protein [Cycloclasticus sp.]
MALENVKLIQKEELTVPAVGGDFMYIYRSSAGGGFVITDYKIKVSNLFGNMLAYSNESEIAAPTEGRMYFDSTTKKFRGYNGTIWVDLG